MVVAEYRAVSPKTMKLLKAVFSDEAERSEAFDHLWSMHEIMELVLEDDPRWVILTNRVIEVLYRDCKITL